MKDGRAVVTFDQVTKSFGRRDRLHIAVDGVSLSFEEGRRIGIVGESGSGKSTVGRMAVGLEHASRGSVAFRGVGVGSVLQRRADTAAFRREVQYIGQDTTTSFDPTRPLMDALVQPLIRLCGMSRADASDVALLTMESLGLEPHLARRRPTSVSGGQRQRFAIARAMVVEPRLVICDEVVSALDVSVQGAVLNHVKDYCERTGAGLVFISHGLPATGFIAEELIVMNGGRVVERGATRDVFASPAHPYTRQLLDAYA